VPGWKPRLYGGWSNPVFGLVGCKAATWGVGTLATAAIIKTIAVDNAVSSTRPTIVVPNAIYQFFMAACSPPAPMWSVSRLNENVRPTLSADCNAG